MLYFSYKLANSPLKKGAPNNGGGPLNGQPEVVARGQLDPEVRGGGQLEVSLRGHERSADFKKKRCFSYSKSTDDEYDMARYSFMYILCVKRKSLNFFL